MIIGLVHKTVDNGLLHHLFKVVSEILAIGFHVKKHRLKLVFDTIKRHVGQRLEESILKLFKFLVVFDVFIHELRGILVAVIGKTFNFGVKVRCALCNLCHLLGSKIPEVTGTAHRLAYDSRNTRPIIAAHALIYLMV